MPATWFGYGTRRGGPCHLHATTRCIIQIALNYPGTGCWNMAFIYQRQSSGEDTPWSVTMWQGVLYSLCKTCLSPNSGRWVPHQVCIFNHLVAFNVFCRLIFFSLVISFLTVKTRFDPALSVQVFYPIVIFSLFLLLFSIFDIIIKLYQFPFSSLQTLPHIPPCSLSK